MNIKGSLTALILQNLSRGPNHGYRIALEIKSQSKGVLDFKEGTLYPGNFGLYRKPGEPRNTRNTRTPELAAETSGLFADFACFAVQYFLGEDLGCPSGLVLSPLLGWYCQFASVPHNAGQRPPNLASSGKLMRMITSA